MLCPSCNSENVVKVKLVYESGTNKIDAVSRSGGSSWSQGGGLGFSSGTTVTSGQSQSLAARNVAPPPKKHYRTPVIMLVLGWVMFSYLNAEGYKGIGLLLMFGAIGVGIYSFLYNKNKWPEAYQIWQRSWQCNRCGHIYVH